MSTFTDIIVRLRAQGQKAFQSSMEKSAESVEKVGDESERSAKRTKAAGRLMGAGMAGAALAAKGLKDGVTNAVDLGEEISKSGVIFGKSSDALIAWSKTTATSLGMSQQEALGAMGTFGNMLVPMGLGRTKAAEMSQTMVKLAGDMASFNNASPADTLDAVRAGLAGETEPLRRYGVFLSDTRIKAEAMGMGLVKASKNQYKIRAATISSELAQRKYSDAVKKHGKNSKEAQAALAGQVRAEGALKQAMAGKLPDLTATQKAQASYSLMLKDTKDTQGDFARTSDSLANRQRILKAQYTNLTAELGSKLLPILTLLANNLDIVAVAVGAVTLGWMAWNVTLAATTLGFNGLTTAMLANPIGLIIIGIVALVAAFIIAYKKVAWFRNAVNAVWAAIKTGVSAATNWIKTAFNNTVKFLSALPGRISGAVSGMWNGMKDAFKGAINWILRGWNSLKFTMPSVDTHVPGVGKVGGFTIGVPPVPLLAGGGTVTRGGMAVVGERGPELVSLPTGAMVTPEIGGTHTTAHFYLDSRLVATAVAQDTANRKARR